MKRTVLVAFAASFAMPVFAEGGPPPAVVSQINLGGAGLLAPFYSGAQKGLTGSRSGQDSIRIGTSGATGATDGFKHETFRIVPSVAVSKSIQDGSAYLTFSLDGNEAKEEPNLTSFDTSIPGFTIGYENFSNPNAAYRFSLSYGERTTESDTSPVRSSADTTEIGFGYARKLSDNWGVVNQTHLGFGDLVVETPGGTDVEPEVQFYTQFELVGAFDNTQAGFVPEGWKLHPIFGISYDNTRTETAAGNVNTEHGSVWAKATLAKAVRPGTWAPNVTLGIEHVYLSDTNFQFMDERTYAIIGAGVTYLGETGSFNVIFERRQGLKGKRVDNTLVAGYTFDF